MCACLLIISGHLRPSRELLEYYRQKIAEYDGEYERLLRKLEKYKCTYEEVVRVTMKYTCVDLFSLSISVLVVVHVSPSAVYVSLCKCTLNIVYEQLFSISLLSIHV